MKDRLVEKIFRVLPDIVFCIKGTDFRYQAANVAFAERLGLSSEAEVIGKRAEDLFSKELAESYRLQDEVVMQKGEEISGQLELITNRDGSLGWYLASKFPIQNEKGEITGLVSISRDLQTPSEGDLQMLGLKKIIDWLGRNLDLEIHTQELAQMARLSESQLERKMKRVFKLSVAQYVRKLRVEKAAFLLKETQTPIAEIALRCGYSEQSSLTRQFKATVGTPPGEYRRQNS